MKRLLQHSILFSLLALAGLTACYQPVDLTPAEDPGIPWVHCILTRDTVQFLELRYIDAAGSSNYLPVEDAEVTIEMWRQRDQGLGYDDEYYYYDTYSFERIDSGLWQWKMSFATMYNIYFTRSTLSKLQVVLPSGDTLRASTTIPNRRVQQQEVLSPSYYVSEFDLNGKHFSYELELSEESSTTLYRHDEICQFSLPTDFEGAIWVYKAGVAEDGGIFIEDALATDRDDWVDPFNITGQVFSESTEPMALANYPEVAGKPLHERFLRFPGGSQRNPVIAVSGDFKGPHYGAGGLILLLARSDQRYEQALSEGLLGIPYPDNILLNGKAGFLRFWVVSPEYDKYLKDVALAEMLKENTDIVGIYNNTNSYTNIQGGTGIFGSCDEQDFYWTCGVWTF